MLDPLIFTQTSTHIACLVFTVCTTLYTHKTWIYPLRSALTVPLGALHCQLILNRMRESENQPQVLEPTVS